MVPWAYLDLLDIITRNTLAKTTGIQNIEDFDHDHLSVQNVYTCRRRSDFLE